MKSKISVVAVIMLLLFTGQKLEAQVVRDRMEKSQDRKEIAISREQLERDLSEFDAFTNKLEKFRIAYLDRDPKRIKSLQAQLLNDMNREIEQSRRKKTADAREVNRSSREVASSNRDVRQSRRDRAVRNDSRRDDVRDLRDDKRDRRDDVRDKRDEHRDFASSSARLERQEVIRTRFAGWVFSSNAPKDVEAVTEYRLLKEFAQTMEADIQATRAELGEDNRELQEDRRELREDKRERRERR